jgi:hypothetical protein
MGKKNYFLLNFFFFKNGFLSLFLIKINRIYSNKEKLCQKNQKTSDNFEKFHIFAFFQINSKKNYQKSAKMAKTLQIQSKTTIKILF